MPVIYQAVCPHVVTPGPQDGPGLGIVTTVDTELQRGVNLVQDHVASEAGFGSEAWLSSKSVPFPPQQDAGPCRKGWALTSQEPWPP